MLSRVAEDDPRPEPRRIKAGGRSGPSAARPACYRRRPLHGQDRFPCFTGDRDRVGNLNPAF
jgi:hypothetical protein